MAKDKKGRTFYELTREKPVGKAQILLMGGSVGASVSFFIICVLGLLYGIEMDDLVFFFILSSMVGFLVGAFLTWLFVRYFSKVVAASVVPPMEKAVENSNIQPEAIAQPESVIPAEEAEKGQTVDFTFPELSPDK